MASTSDIKINVKFIFFTCRSSNVWFSEQGFGHTLKPSLMKTNQSVAYLVIFTQQSSILTARMHHNSQKRINTSKLFWDLCDLTLTQHSPIHPSPLLQQLCVHNTADSAVQETPPPTHPPAPSPDVCHFLTSLFTSAAHGALASTTVETLPPSLTHPPHVRSAAPHKRLSDYKYPVVSSMKTGLTGWVSLKCVMGSACVCAQE